LNQNVKRDLIYILAMLPVTINKGKDSMTKQNTKKNQNNTANVNQDILNSKKIDDVEFLNSDSKTEQDIIKLEVEIKRLQNENKDQIRDNKKQVIVKSILYFSQKADKNGKVERKHKTNLTAALLKAGFNQKYIDRKYQAVAQPNIMKHVATHNDNEQTIAAKLKDSKLTTQSSLITFNSKPEILTQDWKEFIPRFKKAFKTPDDENLLAHVETEKVDNMVNKIVFMLQAFSEKEDK